MNRITRGALSAGALALTVILTVGAGVPAAGAAPDVQGHAVALDSAQLLVPGQTQGPGQTHAASQTQVPGQTQTPGSSGSPSQGTLDTQSTLEQEPATEDEATGIVLIETEMGYESAAAAGTGILLDDEGTILTNNHVIADSTSISVTVADTGQTYEATVVGSDSTQDVAVLTIDSEAGAGAGAGAGPKTEAGSEAGAASSTEANAGSDTLSDAALEPADIAADPVEVGDTVTAVGNAGGAGELQAADGTVTALDASVTTAAEGSAESESLTGMIEVDADIVSGDSGGALLDEDGDVVGVNTAASQGSADITGFAIPIDDALDIAQDIIDGIQTETNTLGYPAFLGVALTSPQTSVPADGSSFRQRGSGWSWESGTESGAAPGAGTGSQADPTAGSGATTASGAGSGAQTTAGAVVGGVYEGTPAAQVGLAQGDSITAVDGAGVADAAQLADVLDQHAPGDHVELTWTDTSGNTHTATVELTEGPAD
ncbi:S1C family serine protease [Brevibacterium senegalense]|uniref:S1C family serine protease n=1 Tax=Brevibacterium senegalense TaxID=1033736 RepID=UPI000474DEE9|nr:trypsin-like peptidase domain-containing protein [Brevibacterium senegalense]